VRNAAVREKISDYFIGVDLGQKQDYTAVCVVERAEVMYDLRNPVTWECQRETQFHLRYMERIRLRTPYPEMVARIKEVATDPALGDRRWLVVDATGVGAPVVDLLCASGVGCPIVPVVITGGGSESEARGERRVPKRDLVNGLQLMFDMRQLQIANGLRETEVLLRELMGIRVRVSAAGHESYGSGLEGPHDDLVLALSLACWKAREPNKWNWFGGRPDGR